MVAELSLAVTAGLEGDSRAVSVPVPETSESLHPERSDMIKIDASTVARWSIFPGKMVCVMAHLTFLHKNKKSYRRKEEYISFRRLAGDFLPGGDQFSSRRNGWPT
jgi:hypothetical protein